MSVVVNDAHVHFFSPSFFAGLGADRERITALGWEFPTSVDELSARWIEELDRHGVGKAGLIASLPGDADAVAIAVAHNPDRFVGFFMLDPTRKDAIDYAKRALDEGLRTICLFPAMHGYHFHDPKVADVFELAASRRGGTVEQIAVFAHCGLLSVGIRKKLGLPSPFDMRFGNPLDLHGLALKYPTVPIIVPHFGAGMLREALMLADCCSNVYFDTSSSNSWIRHTPGLTLEQVFKSALDVIGPDRLIFGTDSSFFPRGWNSDVHRQQQSALDAIGVSADVQRRIFAGNFERVFCS
ncbi:MAG: amidohydrolase [Cyanobacteria bacterium]|nr:amidohydrolase [Cyanobacteriota bacterium]